MTGDAEIHLNAGNDLLKLKRCDEALAVFDLGLALAPNCTELHVKRGKALFGLARYFDALQSFDRAIALAPDHARAHNGRGNALKEMNRLDDALVSYRRALELDPSYAEAYKNIGSTLVNKGDIAGAEEMFVKALAARPDFAGVISNLTIIRKYKSADHEDVRRIQILLSQSGLSEHDREHLYFSLGKIYDDCRLYDDAFEAYRQGNEIRNADVVYDQDSVAKLTHDTIDVFSEDFLAQPRSFGSESRVPIFVCGMPRSGTTLVANMLSNHASVDTAGELMAMSELTSLLPKLLAGRNTYPQAVTYINPAIASLLIKGYENYLRRDVDLIAERVIDKNPFNFQYLGLISMLFPKCHIIHCARNPLDTILSNYFQHFAHINFSYDLMNIGHFYGQYARLMNHWREALPMKIIEIDYEDLIMNTERVVRGTLDALGLAWDERCLAPHTNPCAVRTASNWQVRQPIYTHSVERWRHYEKHLAPLKDLIPSIAPTTP